MMWIWHKRDVLLAVIALAGKNGIDRARLQGLAAVKEKNPILEHYNNRSERWLQRNGYIARGKTTRKNGVRYFVTPAGVMYLSKLGLSGFPPELSYEAGKCR